MKFLADEMCGDLGRWLRLLGYDTSYAQDFESKYGSPVQDNDLIKECFLENRILISRDREMVEKMDRRYKKLLEIEPQLYIDFNISISDFNGQRSPCILLKNSARFEELTELYHKFKIRLNYDVNIARCPKCNSTIEKIKDPNVYKSKIPRNVFEYHKDFWLCPNSDCQKIYWMGTHFEKILRNLDEIKNSIT